MRKSRFFQCPGESFAEYPLFTTLAAAAEVGYRAADSHTYVEIGAGERQLRQALVRVYEFLGKLSDAPESN